MPRISGARKRGAGYAPCRPRSTSTTPADSILRPGPRAAEADPAYPQEHGVRLHHGERSHRQTKKDMFILIPPLYHTGAKMHWFGSSHSGWPGGNPQRGLARVGARSGERGRRYYRVAPRALGAGYIGETRQRGTETGELQARPVAAHAHRRPARSAQPDQALEQVVPRDGL